MSKSKATGKTPKQEIKLNPEDGWALHSASGFMRCGDGPNDKLVSLHDVVAWLMRRHERPLAAAVADVCNALEQHGLDGVYWVDVDDQNYANRADEPSSFDKYEATDRLTSLVQTLRAAWLIKPYELSRLVNVPDHEPEYDERKETPFEFSRRRVDPASRVAITWLRAHELWGWGSTAEVIPLHVASSGSAPSLPADAKKVPMRMQFLEWTGEKLAAEKKAIIAALNREGIFRDDSTKRLADKTGLPEREISRRIKDAKTPTNGIQAIVKQATKRH